MTRDACVTVAFLLGAHAAPVSAQVVLNPSTISGTIEVAGETVDYATISAFATVHATGAIYSARTHVDGGSYSLTVNVPSGTQLDYQVSASAYINGYQQYIVFVPDAFVAVAENTTVTANFPLVPAVITGKVTATSGTMTGGTIHSGSQYASFGPDGRYRLVVQPSGNDITVDGVAYDAYGAVSLPGQSVGALAESQVVEEVDWSVALAATGAIAGTFAVNGSVSPTQIQFYASGPSFREVYAPSNGPYTLSTLYAGSYYTWGYAYFGDSYFQFPDPSLSAGRNAAVADGATTGQSLSANQAFINGTLTVTGARTLADVSSASLDISGVYSTNSQYGSAGTSLTQSNGAYAMVVTDGSWTLGGLSLNFSQVNPGDINESLYFYDLQLLADSIALMPEETATRNLTYATGAVSVDFAASGALFSSPSLHGDCTRRDAMGNLLWYYSFYAYNDFLSDVPSGSVTFVGMDGHCTINASADVNGSNTSFGALEVDVLAPPRIVWTPADGSSSAAADVTVDGTATDADGIQTITINGSPVAFAPTGNLMNEVAFSLPATLTPGDNFITVVATDVTGQSITQTHTVVYRTADMTPPEFSVADITVNATTPSGATVNYSFTATDDVDVTAPVTCLPAGGSQFPIGTTPVNCTATDSSGNQSAHSFNVTVLDVAPVAVNDSFSGSSNAPLVAGGTGVLANDADGNGDSLSAVPGAGPGHGTLALNANGSFTYTPTAGFSGTDSFTYRASDGSLVSSIATVTLTISAPACSGDDLDDDDDDDHDDCDDDHDHHHHGGVPRAKDDHYTVNLNSTLTAPAKSVLKNDGRNAVSAVLVSGPSHGTLTLHANGGFVYKPAAGFTGTDRFVYKAKNAAGIAGSPATVTINVVPKKNGHHDGDGDDHDRHRNGHHDGDGCEHDRRRR